MEIPAPALWLSQVRLSLGYLLQASHPYEVLEDDGLMLWHGKHDATTW